MNLKKTDLFWMLPLALVSGAGLSAIQPGNWLTGFISLSFIFLLSFSLFTIALRWANAGKTLANILALTFALRLLVGVGLYLGLPVYGHEDKDDQAGFVFTDAHIRDNQAWKLASSDLFIFEAFSKKFSSDQYGGLLAFSALVYRYASPDAHRPLMLILFSAIVAALGIPFFWKAVNKIFGEKVAWASAWIFALYPESILLGAAIMREPYLLTFSAMALYGFVNSGVLELAPAPDSLLPDSRGRLWLGIGLLGMLLVSPAVALATLIIFAGWMWFTNERSTLSWKAIFIFALVFVVGLFILSASLNRSGEFNATSPLHVINDWLKLVVKWDAYQLKRGSGWVQKLFEDMPEWLRLPFVTVFGILQPVLPATLIAPIVPIWRLIYFLRAVGWYALLPMLILSFVAGAGQTLGKMRNLIQWFTLLSWIWILFASLRAGGDQWDNPRYRTILFMWQAILAGVVWVWWHETRSAWFMRVVACEGAFLLVFTQWYASRYYHWGGQMPFAVMVALIFGLWAVIVGLGVWRDRRHV
jgi:hypothetical protein